MNSKKINRVNCILNMVLLIAIIIMVAFTNLIKSAIITGVNEAQTFFKNPIIDFFANNYVTAIMVIWGLICLFSIISAIQNRKDKKILFWKLALSISSIITAVTMYKNTNEEVAKWLNTIFFGVLPIILTVINLILIKRNRPKPIQIVSYVITIILAIVALIYIWMDEIVYYIGIAWCFISIVMQYIYTHVQEDNYESKSRKIVNVILYYILQTILSFGILILIVYSMIMCKTNIDKLKNETIDVINKIAEQSDSTKEEFILVEKNSKYGFINEKGEEIIKAEYDTISNFNIFNINDKNCECAFAKKDNNFYIIFKNKKIIDLNENNSEYFKNIYEFFYRIMNNTQESDVLLTAGITYLSASEKIKSGQCDYTWLAENELTADNQDTDNYGNSIYTYNLKNGLQINIIEIEKDNEYTYNIEIKNNKTIISKADNVIIPIDDGGTIELYTNNSIPFCNMKENAQGWYDTTTGQVVSLTGNYQILDATNNQLLIRDYNTNERNEMIIDLKTMNVIAIGEYVDKIKDGYIVKTKEQKMYFVNEESAIKTQPFDLVIDISTKSNGLLMCANKKQNDLECVLIDKKGNLLTKQNYNKIGNNIDWDYTINGKIERNIEYCFDELYNY